MSDLFGKLSVEVEIKAPARDFYEANAIKIQEIPKLCPNFIPKVDLAQGKWGEVGSVMDWHLLNEGKTVVSNVMYENKDDERLSATFKVIGGVYMQAYKSFKFTLQVITKNERSLACWTIEYEKLNVDIPDPKEMLQFTSDLTKEMDCKFM